MQWASSRFRAVEQCLNPFYSSDAALQLSSFTAISTARRERMYTWTSSKWSLSRVNHENGLREPRRKQARLKFYSEQETHERNRQHPPFWRSVNLVSLSLWVMQATTDSPRFTLHQQNLGMVSGVTVVSGSVWEQL